MNISLNGVMSEWPELKAISLRRHLEFELILASIEIKALLTAFHTSNLVEYSEISIILLQSC